MGSTLSDMCYSPVNAEAQLALGIWLKTVTIRYWQNPA
jgi:hypothetical protein